MGLRLSQFLQVLGSGLSPQAYQSQAIQYQADQADRRQQESEQRSDDRNIKNLGIKQKIASIGVMGTAIANETDPQKKQELAGQAGQWINENEPDPQLSGILKNSLAAYLMKKPEKTKKQRFKGVIDGKPVLAYSDENGDSYATVNGKLVKNPKGLTERVTGTTEHDPTGSTTKTKNKIQDTLMKTQDKLASLKELKRTFKRDFFEYKTKVGHFFKGVQSKLGIEPTKEERIKMGEYAKYKRRTFSFLNEYIHALSGAAVSSQEAIRMKKALQNMDDSAEDYESKLTDLMSELEAKQARYEYWAKNGIISGKGNKEEIDKELRSLESEYPHESFAGLNKAKEAIANTEGMTEEQAAERKMKIIKKTRNWFESNGYDVKLLDVLQ